MQKLFEQSDKKIIPLCLAPMVGLSHKSMRALLRSYLPDTLDSLWPTEMLNSRKLPQQILGQTPETLKTDNETNLVPQILGNEEKPIQESILKLKDWGAVAIDINMGCPVKKALRHNYGVSLMGDIKYAAQVLRFAKSSSELPVSVKLRAGLDSDISFLEDFVLSLQDEGADWIALHPRYAHEKRRGKAKWEILAHVKEFLKIPVIGNGDVEILEDVYRMSSETACDMVMIGRALTARPWIFWQWAEENGHSSPQGREGFAPRDPYEEAREYQKAVLFILNDLFTDLPEPLALRKFRFYVKVSAQWLEFGHSFQKGLARCNSLEENKEFIASFFSKPQRMMARTNLRI